MAQRARSLDDKGGSTYIHIIYIVCFSQVDKSQAALSSQGSVINEYESGKAPVVWMGAQTSR